MPGLNDFVAEDGTPLHPPVGPVFWSFRVMVGTGFAIQALSWSAAFVIWRRRGWHWMAVSISPFGAAKHGWSWRSACSLWPHASSCPRYTCQSLPC